MALQRWRISNRVWERAIPSPTPPPPKFYVLPCILKQHTLFYREYPVDYLSGMLCWNIQKHLARDVVLNMPQSGKNNRSLQCPNITKKAFYAFILGAGWLYFGAISAIF